MIRDPAPDAELLVRQSALQAGAADLLAGLELAALVADLGPLLLAAVLDDGVTTPAEFAAWLARRAAG